MKAEHLVIDSCALIKNVDIASMADNMYTCPDVVSEVRDRAVRRMLAVLPYELRVVKPAPEVVQKIVAAAKVTGDYRSLSHTDIQVLALTYELAKTHGESPKDTVNKNTDQIQMGGSIKADLSIPGFYLPRNDKKNSVEERKTSKKFGDDETSINDVKQGANNDVIDETKNADEADDVSKSIEILQLDPVVVSNPGSVKEEEGYADDGSSSDDEGGWITPSTLREWSKDAAGEVKVACMTRDFAMQNVLKKLNLHIASVDGKLIRSLRSYVLRCHACFEITKIMTKQFCPKCGNKTLKRVPVELGPDGSMKMFFSKNPRVLNPKGLQHSLPLPRGGKHANNPILVEDQRLPQNRLPRKALARTDVWSENYECDLSPFASRDVDSKAFRLGIRADRSRKSDSGTRFIRRK